MNLEDHLGDVIKKGRLHAGVALEAVAVQAKISAGELAQLEETGMPKSALDYSALGKLLNLNGAKLEGLAKGWQPAPVDLSQWRELRQITTAGPSYTVNCYLVWDEVTREAAVFDTGFDAAPLFAIIEENQLQLRHLFITHTHSDHVAALAPIREKFPKVRLHSSAKGAPVDQRNRANEFLHLGSLRITNRDTPGHAEDGVSYIIGTWPDDAPHVIVVGDAIFAGSMGRAVGNSALALQKIRDQIFSLPPETLICPGHGPVTTVEEQKKHNPFL